MDIIIRLLVAAAVAVVAYVVGVVVPLEWMHWWVAAVIGLVVAFGGWFVLVLGGDS